MPRDNIVLQCTDCKSRNYVTTKNKKTTPERLERGVTGAHAGFFARTGQFLRDVRTEMKRVSWPTAREVKNTTIITLVAVVFFAVYLWGVDQVIVQLGRFVSWLLSLVGLS